MLALLLLPEARASQYLVKFCAEYSIDFDDADASVGDDYFISNDTDRPARGAMVRVRRNSDNFDMYYNYTSWDGATPGCTGTLVLDSGDSYQVSMQSRALVNGNYVNLYVDHLIAPFKKVDRNSRSGGTTRPRRQVR
jgi:hypothetical protein